MSATSMIHCKHFKIKCTPLGIKGYFSSVLVQGGDRGAGGEEEEEEEGHA